MVERIKKIRIISIDVNVFDFNEASEAIVAFVSKKIPAYICVANVHVCMEAYDSTEYQQIINNAALVIPDGMPLVWAQKILGVKGAGRVRGPDLMLELCAIAERKKIKIGLYGGSDVSLQKLKSCLAFLFPSLDVVISISPPFRWLTEEEDTFYLKKINDAGVDILFVGLGCPKQEKWMFSNRGRLKCVAVGVGAAFDFISGEKKIAPEWMQKMGLEWVFRLLCEPKRLWKRYAKHNPRFLILFVWQYFQSLLKWRKNDK